MAKLGERRNLVGETFGSRTVIKAAPDYINLHGYKYATWLCHCSCGYESIVRGDMLTRNKTKACINCLAESIDKRVPNLVGRKFGDKEVIEKINNYSWKCKCKCGSISNISTLSLMNGTVIKCHECKSKEDRQDIVAGTKFNHLTTIRDARPRNGRIEWVCVCDCGNYVSVRGRDLVNGVIKSCRRNGVCCGPERLGRGYLYRTYKGSAECRNLTFELSLEDLLSICKQSCTYCGKEPSQVVGNHEGYFVYNGIDRVDNAKGYTKENCVPCCGVCNKMKCAMSLEEFKAHIELVYKHTINKNARGV